MGITIHLRRRIAIPEEIDNLFFYEKEKKKKKKKKTKNLDRICGRPATHRSKVQHLFLFFKDLSFFFLNKKLCRFFSNFGSIPIVVYVLSPN
jgi:hypothetical protein